ncbi:outer membrane beta-barrel protein, partial [Helicobacter pylori]
KIPTINTNYYSFMGAELKYRRLYSVYLNYVFAYKGSSLRNALYAFMSFD